MGSADEFSKIASLIGDKGRAVMLWSLLDGKAYTATELATFANVSRQSVSNQLSLLLEANLVAVEKQGRYRYFRLANEHVAKVIESMGSLIPNQKAEIKMTAEAQKLAFARTCYDHMAGQISVALVEFLKEKEIVILKGEAFEVTKTGHDWFSELGIDVTTLTAKKRSFAHKCLDWTERKHHIAGALGAAILEKFLKKDWVRRKPNTRELLITPLGELKLFDELKLMKALN